jgi:integrase
MPASLPKPPFERFPLRPHRNGQWYKSVWNSRTKRTEQFYFGRWADDPTGERAISDPVTGWLARRNAIKAGIENVRVERTGNDPSLGELMKRFLTFKRNKTQAGELSLTTLGDYLREIERFVIFIKPGCGAGALQPEHFSAYMNYLIVHRKLGRRARKRVRAYVTAFLRYGAKNGWYSMPNMGTDWEVSATDPDSIRQAKARAGQKDFSGVILNGRDIDRLIQGASPAFRALILLGINCGMGPADLGRLTWERIDLSRGRFSFPRPKTGVMRVGHLWKRTRLTLMRVRSLRHNRAAIERDGEAALVFVTRKGLPYYREREVYAEVEIEGRQVRKLKRVAIDNAISITFSRLARRAELEGVTFYRLRHTFKTLGKKARDREALDLMMGHKDISTGKVYDHEQISWRRVRRVSRTIYRRLWPKSKQMANKKRANQSSAAEDVGGPCDEIAA